MANKNKEKDPEELFDSLLLQASDILDTSASFDEDFSNLNINSVAEYFSSFEVEETQDLYSPQIIQEDVGLLQEKSLNNNDEPIYAEIKPKSSKSKNSQNNKTLDNMKKDDNLDTSSISSYQTDNNNSVDFLPEVCPKNRRHSYVQAIDSDERFIVNLQLVHPDRSSPIYQTIEEVREEISKLDDVPHSTPKPNRHGQQNYARENDQNLNSQDIKFSSLLEAVKEGDMLNMERLAVNMKFCDPRTDHCGNNLLHLAVLSGKLEMVTFIHEKYPDLVNAHNNQDKSPVELSVERKLSDISSWFLQSLEKEYFSDSVCTKLIFLTAIYDQEHILETIFGKMRDIKRDLADKDENTPAHVAAEFGCLRVLQVLVAHGCDVLSENSMGRSPRYLAKAKGHNSCERYLRLVEASVKIVKRLMKMQKDIARITSENLHLKRVQEQIRFKNGCSDKVDRNLLLRTAGTLENLLKENTQLKELYATPPSNNQDKVSIEALITTLRKCGTVSSDHPRTRKPRSTSLYTSPQPITRQMSDTELDNKSSSSGIPSVSVSKCSDLSCKTIPNVKPKNPGCELQTADKSNLSNVSLHNEGITHDEVVTHRGDIPLLQMKKTMSLDRGISNAAQAPRPLKRPSLAARASVSEKDFTREWVQETSCYMDRASDLTYKETKPPPHEIHHDRLISKNNPGSVTDMMPHSLLTYIKKNTDSSLIEQNTNKHITHNKAEHIDDFKPLNDLNMDLFESTFRKKELSSLDRSLMQKPQ